MDLHFKCRVLYRQYFRQIKRLPHNYLHQFFKLKARDDVHAITRANAQSVQKTRLKRITQDIRRMGMANEGDHKAFNRLLDIAYGRRGKLRRELLEPFLAYPDAEKPPRTISFLERSRPPVYPPPLRALLASEFSRKTKPLKPSYLDEPPTLPARADPKSVEALTFGRLSKRREVNVRWRYFTREISKVYPPLGIENLPEAEGSNSNFEKLGGMQGSNVKKDIELVVGPLHRPPPMTRRERREVKIAQPTTPAEEVPQSRHPSLWVRRRYRYILTKLPLMAFNPSAQTKSPTAYKIGLSNLSYPQYQRSVSHMPEADEVTQAWNTQCITQEDRKVNVQKHKEPKGTK